MRLLGIAVIIFVTHCTDGNNCPPFQLISPCKCERAVGRSIRYVQDGKLLMNCGGDEYWDMKKTFNDVSIQLKGDTEYFDTIKLNIQAINEIPENVFGNLTFTTIFISNYNNFTDIHKNAFNNTNIVRFGYLDSNPNPMVYNDFFSVFKQMENLQVLMIHNTSINEITDTALEHFEDPGDGLVIRINNNDKLTKIFDYTFAEDNTGRQLFGLYLNNNSLNYISKNLFKNISWLHIENSSIKIDLSNNNLNASSFEIGAFNIFHQYEIHFEENKFNLTISDKPSDRNNITYLDQRVFQPFLEYKKFGEMDSLNMAPTLDCDDCRNYWLVENMKHKNYQISEFLCSNQKNLADTSNFKKCVN